MDHPTLQVVRTLSRLPGTCIWREHVTEPTLQERLDMKRLLFSVPHYHTSLRRTFTCFMREFGMLSSPLGMI